MFTQASHHEHQSHDSREGDDQASSMLPALPDAATQMSEAHLTTRPHATDAPAADVASTTDSSRPAADIVAPGVADAAAITAPNGRHPQVPTPLTSAPPQRDPLLAKLLDNEERHADMLDLLLAVIKAREEDEEPRHSAVALPAPNPIPQRAPAAQCLE